MELCKPSESRFWTANSLIAQGHGVKGYHLLTHLLHFEPTHIPARLLRGELLYVRRRFRSARADFLSVLRLDPFNDRACVFLGLICGVRGQIEESRQYFERALALTPEDLQLRWLVAGSCFQLGHFSSALHHLEKILAARPHDPRATCDVAYCHFFRNDLVEARAWFQRVLDREPNNSIALLETAKIAIIEGMTDFARHYLRRLLKTKTRAKEAFTALAYLNHYLDQKDEALKNAKQALEQDTTYLPALVLIAGIDLAEQETAERLTHAVRGLSKGELRKPPFERRSRRCYARSIELPFEKPAPYRLCHDDSTEEWCDRNP